MTEEQSHAKICVVCGKDCSQQRRIKDEHGQYYHKECFKSAKRERQAREAIHAQKEDEVGLAPAEDPDPYALDSGARTEAASAPEGYAATSDVSGPTNPCPSCHKPIPEGALVCSSCSYNLSTGKKQLSSYAEMAASRVGDISGGNIWPIVFGIASILAGIGGLVVYGLLLSSALGTRDGGAYGTAKIVAASVGLLTALIAAISGIGVLRHRQMGIVWLRRWAVLKVVVAIAAAAFVYVGASFLDGFDTALYADLLGRDASSADLAAIHVPVGIRLGWVLLLPIVVLYWYGREKVQKHISDWH